MTKSFLGNAAINAHFSAVSAVIFYSLPKDGSRSRLTAEGATAADILRGVQGGASRVVLRSRHQLLVGVGFGAFVIVVGLLGASAETSRTVAIVDAVGAVVLGGWTVATYLRARVIVTDDGVRIINLVRSVAIPWSRIAGFRIGRHRLLSVVCMVDLTDGRSRHVFAIQRSQIRRPPAQSMEDQMIAFLREQAAAHGAPLRAYAGTRAGPPSS
jgi:hypothetical protein